MTVRWSPRLSTRAKWAATTVLLLLVIAYSVSLFVEIGYNGLNRCISVETGSLYVCFVRGGEPGMPYVDRFPGLRGWVALKSYGPQYTLPHIIRTWFPNFPDPSMRHWTVIIPLWVPFLIVALPTTLLWRLDLRRAAPGQCHRCRYNLTGNTSGICPECGTPITSESRKQSPVGTP